MKKKKSKVMVALALGLSLGLSLQAQSTMVGGQEMMPQKNIVENAVNSMDHTTLVSAVKAAELVETLQSKGPFTVFAPVNDAFENLPSGVLGSLLEEGNKKKLRTVLTYHVLAGKWDFEALNTKIKASGGSFSIETVAGEKLHFSMNGQRNIIVKDAKGNVANISVYDVYQSNGVIHVIDRVLLPK